MVLRAQAPSFQPDCQGGSLTLPPGLLPLPASPVQGKFFEAQVKEILPDEKTIVACFPEDAGFAEACFKIPYDKLVVAVG